MEAFAADKKQILQWHMEARQNGVEIGPGEDLCAAEAEIMVQCGDGNAARLREPHLRMMLLREEKTDPGYDSVAVGLRKTLGKSPVMRI